MRAVLIDDEQLTLEALAVMIRTFDEKIEIAGTAENGIEGLELIRKTQPDFAIVDIRMPRLDGIQLLEKLRENGISTRIVILSAYGEFQYAQHAIKFGAVGYLLKPLSQSQLTEQLEKLRKAFHQEKQSKAAESALYEQAFRYLLDGTPPEVVYQKLRLDSNEWVGRQFRVLLISLAHQDQKTLGNEWTMLVRLEIIERLSLRLSREGCSGCLFFYREDCLVFIAESANNDYGLRLDIDSIREIFRQLVSDEPDIVGGADMFHLHHLHEGFAGYAARLKTSKSPEVPLHGPSDQGDRLIAKAKAYCRLHCCGDISLETVSHHVSMNKSYFSVYFKEKSGTNFWDFVTKLRIDRAIELIKETEKTINEISETVGYRNPSHFGKVFKELVGMTPAEYRKSS